MVDESENPNLVNKKILSKTYTIKGIPVNVFIIGIALCAFIPFVLSVYTKSYFIFFIGLALTLLYFPYMYQVHKEDNDAFNILLDEMLGVSLLKAGESRGKTRVLLVSETKRGLLTKELQLIRQERIND